MKKLIVFVIILAALGSAGWAYYTSKNKVEPSVSSAAITRGSIVEVVQATGTLQAVTTVNVGTQVSGVVQELYADFNRIVRRGDIIARLDPSILQVQIESQEANVSRADADLERLKVTLADAKQKLQRAKELFDKQLVPRTELENAEMTVKSTEAQIKSSEAGLVQSKASLNQAKVNLGYTVIRAPIDGIVIQRSVDPGQTVAASMNAPTLYVIAADLTKMQVLANIDESDVGRMRPGQHVSFRVDAYPNEQFTGSVEQVRLQPAVVQNVVVYSTVISVPNPQLKLKPGMTANVNIEIQRRDNVLRVPAAAVRFRPTEQMFQVLNQPVPPEVLRGQGRGNFGGAGRNGGGRGQGGQGGGQGQPGAQPNAAPGGGSPVPAAPGANAPAGAQAGASPQAQAGQAGAGRGAGGRPESSEARGGGDAGQQANAAPGQGGRGFGSGRGFDPNMTPEERRKRMEERMASMTPEERERFQARMKEREAQGGGFGGGFGGRGQGPGQGQAAQNAPAGRQQALGRGAQTAQGGGRGGNQVAASRDPNRGMVGNISGGAATSSGAMTIDSLFAPLVASETRGRVWIFENKQLRSVQVRLGVSDSTNQEQLEGDLKEGQEVVVNMVTGLETARPGQQQGTGNPLMGPQRGGPGGGGGRGPGGGGRGF